MGIFRPRHPVIITTEVVGGDAKDHFRRARLGQEQRQSPYELDDFDEDESPSGITYIEGLNNLRSGLEKLVTEIYSRDMQAVLAQAVPQGVLSPAALLRAVRSSTGPDLPEATAKMAVGESLQAGVQPEESGVI